MPDEPDNGPGRWCPGLSACPAPPFSLGLLGQDYAPAGCHGRPSASAHDRLNPPDLGRLPSGPDLNGPARPLQYSRVAPSGAREMANALEIGADNGDPRPPPLPRPS